MLVLGAIKAVTTGVTVQNVAGLNAAPSYPFQPVQGDLLSVAPFRHVNRHAWPKQMFQWESSSVLTFLDMMIGKFNVRTRVGVQSHL